MTLAGAVGTDEPDGWRRFPQRDLIIFIATSVILISLIGATIGLPLLLRGLPASNNGAHERERRAVWPRPRRRRSGPWSEELPQVEGNDAANHFAGRRGACADYG